MKITILEPFFAGSHKSWAEGYQQHSQHDIKILSLQGRHWKWRMHGGAVSLANQFLESADHPDLLLASDMLDLSTFLSLTRKVTSEIPVSAYFHENQITYPWSDQDPDRLHGRDNHYGFINFTSALSADAIFFNSDFHREAFLQALGPFLKQFPDHQEADSIDKIKAKSETLHLGLDLKRFDPFRKEKNNTLPVILWNHRWEYDKNPDDFFNALFRLDEEGIAYGLIVLGEQYAKFPPIFAVAYRKLRDRIIHWGYATSFEEYARLLCSGDIALTTSKQDFFGISVMEAIYCGCYPILPKRLAFPEHFAGETHDPYFYKTTEELYQKLKNLITNPARIRNSTYSNIPEKYDWNIMAGSYDAKFANLLK
ncbi:MAG: DUF3524 domain-containing protein [Bacteroidota bacterium]